MVIKSLSRRDPASLGQLLNYFSREGVAVSAPLLHNLPLPAATDLGAAAAEFQANATLLPERKNGVAYYHDILSLAGGDQMQATPEMLLDLAQRYLELRAPAALAYGRVHFDPGLQKNPHLHLLISGNLCGQSKKLRLSKAEFRAACSALERYQQERYPQLTHSLVFSGPPPAPRPRDGRAEQERQRRQGRGLSPQKQRLRDEYQTARLAAVSERDFRFRLQAQGLEPYFRAGRLAGVTCGGKKYRLQTLELADTSAADRQAWRQLPERLRTLDGLAAEQFRERLREHGFARALVGIIEQAGRAALPERLKDRLAGLDTLLRARAGREGPLPGGADGA